MEAARLRIKDIDFDRAAIIIREGKGAKERVVMLPESLRIGLQTQVTRCKQIWNADTETKMSGVEMPFSLDKKYPHAGHSFAWFWVIPQQTYSHDPRSELVRRHHLYPQTFRRAFTAVLKLLAIHKPASPHTFRHSFATH